MDTHHAFFEYDKREDLNKWKKQLVLKQVTKEIDNTVKNLNVSYDCKIKVRIKVDVDE